MSDTKRKMSKKNYYYTRCLGNYSDTVWVTKEIPYFNPCKLCEGTCMQKAAYQTIRCPTCDHESYNIAPTATTRPCSAIDCCEGYQRHPHPGPVLSMPYHRFCELASETLEPGEYIRVVS